RPPPNSHLLPYHDALPILPVAPGERTRQVFLVPVAVGVPRQIEPVAGPPLAEVRRSQQPVDKLLVGVGARIPDERLNFGRRRREDRKSTRLNSSHSQISYA